MNLVSLLKQEWSPSHYSKHKKRQKQNEDKKNVASEGSEEKAANVLDSGKTDLTTAPVSKWFSIKKKKRNFLDNVKHGASA